MMAGISVEKQLMSMKRSYSENEANTLIIYQSLGRFRRLTGDSALNEWKDNSWIWLKCCLTESHPSLSCFSFKDTDYYHLNDVMVETMSVYWAHCEVFVCLLSKMCLLEPLRKVDLFTASDIFPLSLTGVNVSAGRRSRHCSAHRAESVGPTASRAT